jgi:hypothetical protein
LTTIATSASDSSRRLPGLKQLASYLEDPFPGAGSFPKCLYLVAGGGWVAADPGVEKRLQVLSRNSRPLFETHLCEELFELRSVSCPYERLRERPTYVLMGIRIRRRKSTFAMKPLQPHIERFPEIKGSLSIRPDNALLVDLRRDAEERH